MDSYQFDELTKLLATGASRRRTLKVLAGSALASMLSLLGSPSASASDGKKAKTQIDGKKTKVQICHRTDSTTNLVVLIEVDESAIPDHMGHGDTLAPPCQGGELKRDCTCVCPEGMKLCQGQCRATCGCTGGKCGAFQPCGPGGTCLCLTTSTGEGFCAVPATCAGLVKCANGQSDCPTNTICVVNTCCGDPVCQPLETQCTEQSSSAQRAVVAHGPTTTNR